MDLEAYCRRERGLRQTTEHSGQLLDRFTFVLQILGRLLLSSFKGVLGSDSLACLWPFQFTLALRVWYGFTARQCC